MTTTLIIARHGNTFSPDQTPTRVGARTDLPLVESGEDQALRLGHHLKAMKLIPDLVFTSTLRRTIDTARLACVAMMCPAPSTPLPFLNEIDYGPDENKPEPDVRARLGEETLKTWDELGEMPTEWSPRPDEILASWGDFLNRCTHEFQGKTILTVTSNGIARFALHLTQNGQTTYPLKLATGAYGILKFDHNWVVSDWNIRP
jgi:2,3-bisphosphoglycerate-dependent phosphoglycerate mutase